jgi:D-alanyl-D-alanine carboxypeptidase/D-alanyl-D-alanine-endopeptidase (penicillin-binding protein 4)
VSITGNISKEGVLKGDVIIHPSGDPSLASRHISTKSLRDILSEVHQALRDQGITCVDGYFLLKDSGFTDNPVPGSWPREDVGNYYGAGYFPLNILDNTYEICFSDRDQVGDRPVIQSVDPHLKNVSWKVNLITAEPRSGDQAYIFGGPETDRKTIYGTIPAGKNEFCIKGSIPDPPAFFMDTLAAYCRSQGMQHNGTRFRKDIDDRNARVCWKHLSPPLKVLVHQCLKKSLNGYADAFLFMLERQGQYSWNNAAGMLTSKIDRSADGPKTVLFDGSGMSPANGITSKKMASALSFFYNNMDNPEEFVRLFTRDGKVNSIYLKSGSLAGVIGFSGFIIGKDITPVCFSIMANQVHPEQKAQVRESLLEVIRLVADVRN